MKTHLLTAGLAALALAAACQHAAPGPAAKPATIPAEAAKAAPAAAKAGPSAEALAALDAVLADPRREKDKARDQYRHPRETLVFFGVEPDDTVVEALPGGGWYTRILLPFATPNGRYMAINYPMPVFEQLFGDGLTPERRATLESWDVAYLEAAKKNGPEGAAVAAAFRFGAVPPKVAGQADHVLYVRALHNLARFGMLDQAAADCFAMLKPGGVCGVVQHRAKPDAPAAYVDGSNGYLKEADVIAAFEKAGFTLEAKSEVNANPKDAADHEGGVWMLQPASRAKDDDPRKPALIAIGESDRMTLKFRKPG